MSTTTITTEDADEGPTRFDQLLVTAAGALFAALASTYYMTVTNPDHVYQRDFVLVGTDDGVRAGEVVHVHQESNSLAVRMYRDGAPTNELMAVPAEMVDLHPDGRPLADDDEWDAWDDSQWTFTDADELGDEEDD